MTQPIATSAKRQITYELISGGTGLVLALFMWGHVALVGSILTGERGFDWLASFLEDYYIAQPTILAIFFLFLVHAVFAARKIPAQLAERKRIVELSKGLRNSGKESVPTRTPYSPFRPHLESMLWIWQVRTGMIMLVLGSFHLVLLMLDIFTPLYGDMAGIESGTSMARVQAGLWLPYAILLLCVEFHASVGLYRLEPDGDHATRVQVELGRASVDTIEILRGLEEGDGVILSDTSRWDDHDRIRLR